MQYTNESFFDVVYTRMYSLPMTIGNRLDTAMREAKILSQSELARRSGVPQATISRILKGGGSKGPETETVRRLANACNVKFEWLNEGAGNQGEAASLPAAAVSDIVTPEEIIELITLYKDARPGDRKMIMKAARLHRRRKQTIPTAADR
jgi:transcriptional regulator with XRE-family HTH domain